MRASPFPERSLWDKVYCYYCRSYHAPEEVRLVQSKSGKRWRCLKSIASSQASREQRDAFGRSVSELNRLIGLDRARRSLPYPVKELFKAPVESRV